MSATCAARPALSARPTRPSPSPSRRYTTSASRGTRSCVGFEVGDTVKVIDGPLDGFLGTVEELEPEKDRVRVVVSMFGRETPVDLELDQVEPVKD